MRAKTALSEKIKIGSMDRPITFRSFTELQSATGHSTKTWADAFSELAAIDYSTNAESYQADRQIGMQGVTFITRKNTNTETVTNKWRLQYDSKEYDIEGVTEPLGRNRFLKFQCKLRD